MCLNFLARFDTQTVCIDEMTGILANGVDDTDNRPDQSN